MKVPGNRIETLWELKALPETPNRFLLVRPFVLISLTQRKPTPDRNISVFFGQFTPFARKAVVLNVSVMFFFSFWQQHGNAFMSSEDVGLNLPQQKEELLSPLPSPKAIVIFTLSDAQK